MDIYAELKRLGSLIRQLQGALGGKAFVGGNASISFSAASSSSVTVTHGLGTTPTVVMAVASGNSSNVNCAVGAVGATTFTLKAQYLDGVSRTTSEPAYWLAWG